MGSKKQEQKSELSIPEFYKPYWNSAMSGAQSLYNSNQLAPVVGMSDATKTGLDSQLSLANNLQGTVLPKAQESFMSLLNSNLVGSNELNNAITAASNPVMRNLERYAVPQTQDAALAAGQFGSSRQGIAEGLARSDANQQILDMGSQMSWGALQQDQQNKQFANSNLPAFIAAMQIPANLQMQVGGIQEGYQQEAADAPMNNLLKYFQLVQSMNPGTNQTTTVTTKDSAFNKLGALGSLALQAYSGGALGGLTSLFSKAPAAAMKGAATPADIMGALGYKG